MKALAAALLLAAPAFAQDHITVNGTLDDEAFYRLVACAAPPSKPCQKPFVRWQLERPLRIWTAPLPDAYLGGKAPRAKAAVTRALQELNRAGMGLSLGRTQTRSEADILIFFQDQPHGEAIIGTGLPWVDGARLGGATVRMQAIAAEERILRAAIAVSTTLRARSYEGVLLEELTQALGLMTDIDSPAYEGVSVLSQKGNSLRTLGPQDRAALRRHYPAN